MKSFNVSAFNKFDLQTFKALDEGLNISIDGSVSINPIVLYILEILEAYKLEMNRSPRIIIISETGDEYFSFIKEMNNFMSKKLIIVSCSCKISMKKNKLAFCNGSDLIIGEAGRIHDLILSNSFELNNIILFVILNADKILMSKTNENDINHIITKIKRRRLTISNLHRATQFLIKWNNNVENISPFTTKHVKHFININKDHIDEFKEYKEETKLVEINDFDYSLSEDESSENASMDELNKAVQSSTETSEEIVCEPSKDCVKSCILKQDLVSEYFESSKIDSTRKFPIVNSKCDTSLHSISECNTSQNDMSLNHISEYNMSQRQSFQMNFKWEISLFSGRLNYTAYLFKSNQQQKGKRQFFKNLQKKIDRAIVTKIDKFQETKDKMGYIFDLPCEYNQCLQECWYNEESEMLSLLTENYTN